MGVKLETIWSEPDLEKSHSCFTAEVTLRTIHALQDQADANQKRAKGQTLVARKVYYSGLLAVVHSFSDFTLLYGPLQSILLLVFQNGFYLIFPKSGRDRSYSDR